MTGGLLLYRPNSPSGVGAAITGDRVSPSGVGTAITGDGVGSSPLSSSPPPLLLVLVQGAAVSSTMSMNSYRVKASKPPGAVESGGGGRCDKCI